MCRNTSEVLASKKASDEALITSHISGSCAGDEVLWGICAFKSGECLTLKSNPPNPGRDVMMSESGNRIGLLPFHLLPHCCYEAHLEINWTQDANVCTQVRLWQSRHVPAAAVHCVTNTPRIKLSCGSSDVLTCRSPDAAVKCTFLRNWLQINPLLAHM